MMGNPSPGNIKFANGLLGNVVKLIAGGKFPRRGADVAEKCSLEHFSAGLCASAWDSLFHVVFVKERL